MVTFFVLTFGIVISTLALSLPKTFARGILKAHSKLTSPPTQLSKPSIVGLLVLVVLKYAVRGLGELFGFLSPLKYDESTRQYLIPRCSVSAQLRPESEDIRLYDLAVSFPETQAHDDGSNPLFLLIPMTNPLLLHLLTKYTTPILPLGSINVRNRFEFIDPNACQNLRSRDLHAIATMGGASVPGRVVKRGMEFDIEIVVTSDEKPIFRQVFTVLQFLQHRGKVVPSSAAPYQMDVTPDFDMPAVPMTIDFDAPARWARLCKDYNPIHVSSFTARLFGFPGKIAHGNLVAGMVLQRFFHEIDLTATPSFLEVDFRRPMVVPLSSSVKITTNWFALASRSRNGEEKVHVESRWGQL
jgi:acyl dehydratase